MAARRTCRFFAPYWLRFFSSWPLRRWLAKSETGPKEIGREIAELHDLPGVFGETELLAHAADRRECQKVSKPAAVGARKTTRVRRAKTLRSIPGFSTTK